jgi:hypothetical protein
MDEHLFVIAEPMEEIKDRKALLFVRVIAGRKQNAVGNSVRKDFAGEGVAFDAAGGGEGGGDAENEDQEKTQVQKANLGHPQRDPSTARNSLRSG